jgi:CheY-like chemotaxis protein
MMPGTSGLMMMNRLREQNDWGKKVPVIFFSNVGTANPEEKALLDTINPIGYLPKGETSLETIIQKIKDVFVTAKPADTAR